MEILRDTACNFGGERLACTHGPPSFAKGLNALSCPCPFLKDCSFDPANAALIFWSRQGIPRQKATMLPGKNLCGDHCFSRSR